MNFELEIWENGVKEHLDALDTLINDRKILKEMIEEHLKQFFDYHEIEFSQKFDVITLKWEANVSPIIRQSDIHLLGMDWIIRTDYDKSVNRIVVIEIYPFGIETLDEDGG